MKVEWNKVTWYSKLIALVLFIALPFFGFWVGVRYGQMIAPLYNSPGNGATGQNATGTVATTGSAGSDYYTNVAEWQTDTRLDGGFSIAYPIDFQADDNFSTTAAPGWRLNDPSNSPGLKFFTITIPAAFEPQTNFADATLTVGKSSNSAAIADCLTPDQSDGPAASSTTSIINGISFSVFKSVSVGAGNTYETTSYRVVNNGACYAVEYTIHSSQVANYPPEYNLKPFDEGPLTDVLNRMVGTFSF